MGMGMDVDMDMDAYWLVSWTELGRELKGASVLSVTTHVGKGWLEASTRRGKGDGSAYWVLM